LTRFALRGSLGSIPEPPRFLEQVRAAVRTRHYSRRTEEAYVGWTKRFILFHRKRHPGAMGADEVNAFLSHLAVQGRVSASTQAQALSALVFLYRHVLDDPLPWIDDIIRSRRKKKLPVVLTREEVRSLLLVVREGKGAKDRRTMLPDSLQQPLRAQIEWVRGHR
jgi:integrase